MKARKLLALALVGGLVVGGVGVAEGAKKKKKKPRKIVKIVPTPQTLYMRNTGTSCQDDKQTKLLAEPSTGADLECWGTDNFLQEPFHQVANEYLGDTWAAEAAVPFTMNATEAITGTITIKSADPAALAGEDSGQSAGVGNGAIDVVAVGETGGQEVVIGTFAEEYEVTPGGVYTFEYEIDVADELDKAVFDSFALQTFAHGVVFNHGIIELDDPASTVTIPTLVKKTVKK